MKSFNILWKWKEVRKILNDRDEPRHIRLLADLYWKGLLLLAFVTLVSVFLYSIWGLTRILSGLNTAPDTSASPRPALNRAELNATVSAFETRKTQFQDFKTNPPAGVKDPSI